MSVVGWFQNFIDSCSKKKDARSLQVEQPVVSSSRPGVRVWTSNSSSDSLHDEGAKGMLRATQLLDPPSFMQEDASPIRYLADVPAELRDRIQQDGMARSMRQLETPLKALQMATSRRGANYPAEELRGFLLMWRQALSDYIGLVPDERSVLTYDRSVDEAYFVRGRCEVGAHLTILEPCWRLNGEVVVRGEAQVVQGWVR